MTKTFDKVGSHNLRALFFKKKSKKKKKERIGRIKYYPTIGKILISPLVSKSHLLVKN